MLIRGCADTWKPKDNSVESVLSFHLYMTSRDEIQVPSLTELSYWPQEVLFKYAAERSASLKVTPGRSLFKQ